MSEAGFSPEWLSLREPVDARSRDAGLLRKLAETVAHRDAIDIVDLGCGTGSNLRATALAFPPRQRQRWRLCDYNERLLAAARDALTRWTDTANMEGEALALRKGERRIDVTFHKADLRGDFANILQSATIVTASAFFDLASEPWIARFAEAAASARAHVYAPLIYNGLELWQPPQVADGPMLTAFCAHQRTDKGFGPACGPKAGLMLGEALLAKGYRIETGESPWRLGADDRALMEVLAAGAAEAISSLSLFDASTINAWLEARSTASTAIIGHVDVLALA